MNQLSRLRAALAAKDIPAVVVTDPINVGWLTGFSGTFARVIVSANDCLFITDSRYTLQAAEEAKGFPVTSFATPTDGDTFLGERLAEFGLTTVAFEDASTTFAAVEGLRRKLSGVELVPVGDLLNELRMTKSADEIATIKRACAIADAAFDHMLPLIQAGRTEIDVDLDLEFYIRRQGAEIAFPAIVVSGERSARPHGHANEKRLERGDFVTMDFGARVDGYNSDMTRTVVVGEASDRHREVYGQVLKAQLAALAAMRPGVPAREIDRTAREVLDEIGLAKFFGHGLGHGLGRLVHDPGRLSPSSDHVLAVGQVWTVEPGVYIEGFGGVRIEDDVVITETGIEILTHSTKELLIVPRG